MNVLNSVPNPEPQKNKGSKPVGVKEYSRNQKKRKEYIHQSGLLITGVNVSKVKHDACIGTLEGVRQVGFGASSCQLLN